MAIELHHLNTHGMMEQAGKVLDSVSKLKARIAELEEERRWRKCSEELPEEAGDYLVANYNGTRVSIATFVIRTDRRYFGGIPFGLIESGVAYWMPLPKAPEVK